MFASSFVWGVIVPTILLMAAFLTLTTLLGSKSRRTRQAYEQRGANGLAEALKVTYLKGEKTEGLDAAGVLDLAQVRVDRRSASLQRLERLLSLKVLMTGMGVFAAALALLILAEAVFDLQAVVENVLVIALFSLLVLFIVIRFGMTLARTMFITDHLQIKALIERARADLADGAPPEAPPPPAPQYEATYVKTEGRDYDVVRAELSGLFAGSWFKPWMHLLTIGLLLGIQVFLATGDEPLESTYGNPWLLFAMFALAAILTYLIGVRIVYFSMVSAFARKGPSGLRDMNSTTTNPGAQVLLVLTTIGILPTVLGFVFFFATTNWPGSLILHAASLSWVLCFQLRLSSFTDRMAENVMYLAGLAGNEAVSSASLVKVSRRIFSREMG